ncbi:MAG TPA: FkbM family methyltransferase [Candidatus Eremiobacteraceae bacterium]
MTFALDDIAEIVRAVPLSMVRLMRGNVVRTTVHGHPFYVDTRDNIVSFDILFRRTWEPRETALLGSIIEPGDHVIDIGGHIGYYAVMFGMAVGSTGRVLAVEPDPDNAAVLRMNVALNNLEAVVTVIEAAAGEKSSSAELFRADSRNRGDHRMYSTGTGRTTVDVRVIAIDESIAGWDRVDLIKMDIQGFEPHALKGMMNTLRSHENVVLVTEFWPHGMRLSGCDPENFLAQLRALGFSFFTMTREGALTPAKEEQLLAEHARPKSFTDIVCARAAAVERRLKPVLA